MWNKLFSSDKLDSSLLLEMQDVLSRISLNCYVFPLTIINLDPEAFHQSRLSFALCGSKLMTVCNLNWMLEP